MTGAKEMHARRNRTDSLCSRTCRTRDATAMVQRPFLPPCFPLQSPRCEPEWFLSTCNWPLCRGRGGMQAAASLHVGCDSGDRWVAAAAAAGSALRSSPTVHSCLAKGTSNAENAARWPSLPNANDLFACVRSGGWPAIGTGIHPDNEKSCRQTESNTETMHIIR